MNENMNAIQISLMSEEEICKLTGRLTLAEQTERARQSNEASNLIGVPINDWPHFDVKWDTNPEKHNLAFDGMSTDDFVENYPNGLIVAQVKLVELDAQLCNFNKRTPEEVWGVGSNEKAAKVILNWVEGKKITPPMIRRTNGTNEICLGGGNHRLAVARAKEESKIFVLIDPLEFDFVSGRLSLHPVTDREPS